MLYHHNLDILYQLSVKGSADFLHEPIKKIYNQNSFHKLTRQRDAVYY